MAKICGVVNYKINKSIAEDFNSLSFGLSEDVSKRMIFSHYNCNDVFVGLSTCKQSASPYTIVYKGIKYTFIFDGVISNSSELLSSISLELGFTPTNEEDHASLAAWAYILWGGFSPQRLFGRFAYAIYSEPLFEGSVYSPRLFIARDRLGIKPLYFSYKSNDSIVFSSSISNIVSYIGSSPKLSISGLWQIVFLDSYAIEGKTIFRDVYELQPGCCAYIDCRRDGSFAVMQKRYFSLKHPKAVLKSAGSNNLIHADQSYLEESISSESVISTDELEDCISITEAPYIPINYRTIRAAANTRASELLYSNIGKEAFILKDTGHIKSFFPWKKDPYESIELLRDDVVRSTDGFNDLYRVYIEAKDSFTFEEDPLIQDRRAKMCMYYFIDTPNKLKYNEMIADHYHINIEYPYADNEIFEYYYSNLDSNASIEAKCQTNKNSEFDEYIKQKLKKILTNSEYKINYIIDKNKALKTIDSHNKSRSLELIYLIHIWLEKFDIDFDF